MLQIVLRLLAALDLIVYATMCAFGLIFIAAMLFGLNLPRWAFVFGLLCMLRLSVLGTCHSVYELIQERRSKANLGPQNSSTAIDPNWNDTSFP
jgi:hypothetical protein